MSLKISFYVLISWCFSPFLYQPSWYCFVLRWINYSCTLDYSRSYPVCQLPLTYLTTPDSWTMWSYCAMHVEYYHFVSFTTYSLAQPLHMMWSHCISWIWFYKKYLNCNKVTPRWEGPQSLSYHKQWLAKMGYCIFKLVQANSHTQQEYELIVLFRNWDTISRFGTSMCWTPITALTPS